MYYMGMRENKEAETPPRKNNGFPNRETECVVLWLDSNNGPKDCAGSERWIREVARVAYERGEQQKGRLARLDVEEQLRDYHEALRDLSMDRDLSNVIADLVGKALHKVDWCFLGHYYIGGHLEDLLHKEQA